MTMHALLALVFAPSGQQGGPGMVVFISQIALFIGIFYFFLIRPQRQQAEKHKQLLASLQRGDQVVTSGGVVAEVVHIKDDLVTIRSGEAKFVVLRSGITSITSRGGVEAKTT